MLKFFTLLFCLSLSAKVYCQSMCGTVNEGQTLTLTAPAGMIFISVSFASYGTPNGSCGSFTLGGCHAANSQTIVQTAVIGNNSGSISATNGVFGDPCGGTFKRLYVEAVYSAVTPLSLLSLTGTANGNNNLLQWQTANEVNTKEFIIERSADGIQFAPIGVVKSNNRRETNKYSFSDNLFNRETSFYRLKMTDIDASFTFSKIVAIKNGIPGGIRIGANPVSTTLNLNGLRSGWGELINLQGEVLQKLQVNNQTLHLDLSSYSKGIYFIRYFGEKGINVHKIVKQ